MVAFDEAAAACATAGLTHDDRVLGLVVFDVKTVNDRRLEGKANQGDEPDEEFC